MGNAGQRRGPPYRVDPSRGYGTLEEGREGMKTVFYSRAGMTKVAPGLYVDANQQAHLMIPELLDHYGYADTPANRDVAVRAALTAWQEAFPGIPVREAD